MKIIPSVLVLTFVGFLPNDCDAMVPNSDVTGGIRIHTEHNIFQNQFLKGTIVPLWMEVIPETAPDFTNYQAFVRFSDNSIHTSRNLRKITPPGNPDRNRVPLSYEAQIKDLRFECKESCNWQTYDPVHPPPRVLSYMYITIPHTKLVLYTVIRPVRVVVVDELNDGLECRIM